MDHRPPRPDQPYAWDDERLSAYLDGELSAPEQAQLEARLVVDPELRQLVDELRAVRQQLEILPEYHLQASFAEQVLRRAEQEMLLSPVARETTSVTIAAATTTIPTVPATSVESAATPLPRRSLARRWQRGAIWTAVAAAAVLLLIVTNRPPDPGQDHIAQHDPEPKMRVDHGLAKLPGTPLGSAENGSKAATFSAPHDGVAERQGLDKLKRDAKGTPSDSAADAPLAKLGQQSDAQKALEGQAFPFASPSNAPAAATAPKPADGLATKAVEPQLARAAGGKQSDYIQQPEGSGQAKLNDASDKLKNDAAPGKMLMKSQAFGAAPGIQAGAQRKELSAYLTTFFASEDFKQLTLPRDDNKTDEAKGSQDEQILVVYLTPRAEPSSDRSFESLLASNSIELAEKTLGQATLENRPLASNAAATPDGPAGEPLANTFSDKTKAGEAKDRKATDLKTAQLKSTDARGASKPQVAASEAKQLQDKNIVPESQLSAAYDVPSANELYYLEADEGQVQELLRQLRVAPDRFARLSIAERELPQAGERANLRLEQSLPLQSSPVTAERKRSEAAAATEPSGDDENGKQLASAQQAQAARPAPSPVVTQPPAVPALAAEPEAAPLAPPAATAPAVAPLPQAPQPSAPIANAAPAAAGIARPPAPASDVPTPLAEAFSASPGKPNTGQANETLGNADARSNRRALVMEQQSPATGERAIAYRLRGLEALSVAGDKHARNRGQGSTAGAGGGGAGGFAKMEMDKAPAAAAKQQMKSGKQGGDRETGDALQQNSNGAVPGQPAKSDTPAPALTEPPAEMKAGAESKAKDQDEALRMLTRNKEAEQAQKNSPVEAAKKSAAPSSKRVRVLFVIEQEAAK